MSGLVMGIILSRTFAGFVSTYWSWEGVFLSSGILTLGFALLMWHKLPNTQPQPGLTVTGIYRSLFKLARHHPHLIRRACAGVRLWHFVDGLYLNDLCLGQRALSL